MDKITKETNQPRSSKKKNWTPFQRNLFYSSIALIAVVIFVCGYFLLKPTDDNNTHHTLDIQMICELTTLECHYHNVAVYQEDGGLLDIGKKNVWIEFDGIVEFGIDASQVHIEAPNEDGIVRVHLPKAKILASDVEESTISKPVYDLGLFAEFTGEDERQLINHANEQMVNDAALNALIFNQAYNNAKNIIEQHIINLGRLVGKDYTVEWIVETDNS